VKEVLLLLLLVVLFGAFIFILSQTRPVKMIFANLCQTSWSSNLDWFMKLKGLKVSANYIE
jgi:hypothetical protein